MQYKIRWHFLRFVPKLWPPPQREVAATLPLVVNRLSVVACIRYHLACVYKFNVSNALTSSSLNDMTIFSDASLYSCKSSSHSMLLLTSLMIDDSKTHCFAVKPFILNVLFFIISKP